MAGSGRFRSVGLLHGLAPLHQSKWFGIRGSGEPSRSASCPVISPGALYHTTGTVAVTVQWGILTASVIARSTMTEAST